MESKNVLLGVHITPTKSVLSNLPIYFISLFKCPLVIAKHIKKIRQDFIWQGKEAGQQFVSPKGREILVLD